MSVKIKPMTKRELADCFQVYRQAFPEWTVEHDVVLSRSNGPIKQYIAFEALRAGSYRPSCSVEVAGTPERIQLLFQFLDIKHRDVLPREHPTKWPKVLKAMEKQFRPSLRKPLEVDDVIRLAEEEVERDGIDNVNYFTGLAVLHAHAENVQRALFWCDLIEHQVTVKGGNATEWEMRLAEFTCGLREALRSGKERAFLRTITSQHG